jgi:cardiolipin synthase
LKRISYRDHRKILVVDDAAAFVGGCNIALEYSGDGVTRGWRDLGLQVDGQLAVELSESFDRMFHRADFRHERFQRLRRSRTERVAGHQNWRLILGGPGRNHRLKRTLASDLAAARSIQIISAYFLPTWRIRRELRRVARAGGRVQLILAGKSDVVLSQLATRHLYRGLLRAGVEIYEYQPQVLHTKLVVADDIIYAGSANLDARSLNINYELLVRVADATLAAEARDIFASDLPHCLRIDPKKWARSRGFFQKLLEYLACAILSRLDPSFARWQLRGLRAE